MPLSLRAYAGGWRHLSWSISSVQDRAKMIQISCFKSLPSSSTTSKLIYKCIATFFSCLNEFMNLLTMQYSAEGQLEQKDGCEAQKVHLGPLSPPLCRSLTVTPVAEHELGAPERESSNGLLYSCCQLHCSSRWRQSNNKTSLQSHLVTGEWQLNRGDRIQAKSLI